MKLHEPAKTQQLQNYEGIKNGLNARSLLIPRFRVRPNEELSDIKALNNSRNILEISLPRQIKYSRRRRRSIDNRITVTFAA